jgi:glycosyltransferase involved in cell wall biosynthesis
MTTNLTSSLIVRNEEPSLGRCLDSVQGLADEIIVVDTGSMDVEADTHTTVWRWW